MKIELTIQPNYLSHWNNWSATREIIQNGIDAEQDGYPLQIIHTGKTLRVVSEGIKLPHEALLLGYTTKTDKEEMIGQWGEGLKMGMLVLARQGIPIRIRNQDEIWKPEIRQSEKFNSQVLVVSIRKARKPCNDFVVEVDLPQEEWEQYKGRFLRFLDVKKQQTEYRTL